MSITTAAPHWTDGPFHHIEGLDAEVDILPAPPVPQFVVQQTTEGGHWQVGGVDPRHNGQSVDGIDYTVFDTAKRAATVLNAVKAVFDMAPVPHHLDRTQPHPRAVKDRARNVYGIEVSDAEITAAVKVVMA